MDRCGRLVDQHGQVALPDFADRRGTPPDFSPLLGAAIAWPRFAAHIGGHDTKAGSDRTNGTISAVDADAIRSAAIAYRFALFAALVMAPLRPACRRAS
jgi:hypothetical protein